MENQNSSISKTIIIFSALGALVLLIGLIVWGAGNRITEQEMVEVIPEDTWITYTNEKYGFSFKHPEDWQVTVDDKVPGIHVYKKSDTKPEYLTHHNAFTNVSIYPEGIGTEGVLGQMTTSTILFSEPIVSAYDYFLKNNQKWATIVTFKNQPESWQPWGYAFARVLVGDEKVHCEDENGKTLSPDVCDIGVEFMDTNTIREGEVNEEDRRIEERILETFRFAQEQ